MAQTVAASEVALWIDASRVQIVRQVLDLMGRSVRPIVVGGPRAAVVDELAQLFDCVRGDDLRKMLVERPAQFVLLATMTGLQDQDIAQAVNAGSTVLTLEPAWSELAPRRRGADDSRDGLVVFVPSFDRCTGWISAAEPMHVLGRPRLIGFTSRGKSDQMGLLARLYDAWRTVLRLGTLPEQVDASLVSHTPHMPQDLRAMSGHMAVHARIDGAAAVIDISDQAPVGHRALRVLGDDGQWLVTDDGYELHGPTGDLLDSRAADLPITRPTSYGDLIAQQWRRLLDQAGEGSPQADLDEDQLTSCCLACLLSARTGQPESPGRLLAAHGRR